MRLTSIQFENYKLLRDTTLPLEPLTVIVGPNDSGKSTALQAIRQAAFGDTAGFQRSRSIGPGVGFTRVQFAAPGRAHDLELVSRAQFDPPTEPPGVESWLTPSGPDTRDVVRLRQLIASARVFSFAADAMRVPVLLVPEASLTANGSNLAVVLDRLRDQAPDRWDALNAELREWLPAFDRVLFDTFGEGLRAVALRAPAVGGRVPAAELSDGTLLVLALLTLVHAEDRVGLIGIEEPEIGLHPRLMRSVRDALLRIAYPAENGVDREPRQVIVTTHSPAFLDLFRDLPRNVVVAERHPRDTTFHRLSDHPDLDDILSAGPLGEAWYTGVLGGVPAGT